MEKRKSFITCSLAGENPPTNIINPSEDQRIPPPPPTTTTLALEPYEARQSEDDNHGETPSLSFKSCELGSNHENDSTKCTPSDSHHFKRQKTALRGLPGDAMTTDVMNEKSGGRATKISEEDDCGRERLKRHRTEMGGRVWIPDIWGQEELLKDWIDCSAFDSSLVHSGIMSARSALIAEGRRANSSGLRIQYRC